MKPAAAAIASTAPGWRALLLAVGLLLGSQPVIAADAPPPAVTVAPVVAKDIAPARDFIGRVEAIQRVDIRARVQGFLQQVAFQEGQDVEAGQLLFVIEPDTYQAAVTAAQAQLDRAQATLKQAEQNLARRQELLQSRVESQATLEQAQAQRDTAAADVEAAKANLQTAQINLGYTRIESPIKGRIGRALVTKGNLVGPDSGTLATVVQLDPIRVVFSVDDRTLLAVQQKYGTTSPEQLAGRFVPRLRLADGSMYSQAGKIAFSSNEVDPQTGTIPIRAEFPNPQGVLLPGQFVTVVVQPEEAQRQPVVPVQAVQEDRQGKFVLVVDANNRVEQRRIKAEQQVGQDWVVQEGLREGESVIVEGLQKVRPGMPVNPVPANRPPAAAQASG